MNTAVEEYTRAYSYLLDWCQENIATIEAEGTEGKAADQEVTKCVWRTKWPSCVGSGLEWGGLPRCCLHRKARRSR